MGVRKQGILEVDNGGSGPGTAVDINSPIGANTMADSVSITVATDQTSIPVDIGAVGTLDVNIVSPLGQTVKASSIPVTLASDQPAIAVTTGAGSKVIITDGVDDADVVSATVGKGLQIHTGINNGSGLFANDPIMPIAGFTNLGSYAVPHVTTSHITSDGFPGLNTYSHQGMPNTSANNWPVRITDGTDDANVEAAGVGKGLQIHTNTKNGSAFFANDPVFVQGALSNLGSTVALFRLSQADASTSGLQTVTAQGEPNTVAKAWPTLVTDGTNTATVKAANTTPSYTADKAVVVELRNSEVSGSSPQSTRLVPIGAVDEIGRNIRLSAPIRFSGIGGFAQGLVTRNIGADLLNIQLFNGGGQLLQSECRSLNNTCFYIDVVDGGGWNGTLTPSGYITSGPENNIRAYDIAARTFVDTLSAGKAYYVSLFGASQLNIRSTNYVGGTCTVRVGGAQNGAQFIINESLNAGAQVALADTDSGLTVGNNNTLTQTPEGYLRTMGGALVSSEAESYSSGDTKPLSITPFGRLRVASVPSYDNLFMYGGNPWAGVADTPSPMSPWES